MKTIVCLLMFVTVAFYALTSEPAHSQGVTGMTEVVQLQPFRTLLPGEAVYIKVGTVGTNELQTCLASTRIYQFGNNKHLEIYCHIQADGYAGVYFYNRGNESLGIYDKIRVTIF